VEKGEGGSSEGKGKEDQFAEVLWKEKQRLFWVFIWKRQIAMPRGEKTESKKRQSLNHKRAKAPVSTKKLLEGAGKNGLWGKVGETFGVTYNGVHFNKTYDKRGVIYA